MNVEKYILNNVKLFTNIKYFKLFNTILINTSKNIFSYQKYNTLFDKVDNNKNNIKLMIKNNNSYWFILMKIILNKLELKEKSIFTIDQNYNIDSNPIISLYLIKLCKTKIQKLLKLSIKLKAPLNNLIRLYLDLCDKQMYPEKYEMLNNKKKKKSMEISLENTNKYNNSQATRLYSSSKNKINKNNKIKKILSLNNINHNDNNSHDDEDDENNVQKKYGIGKLKLSYCNSLSRLFIGDTDEKSVKEKYLENITVKKEQKLKVKGVNMTKAESYTKRLINEIKHKGVIIDQNLAKIIDKFNKEQKVLEEYKKSLKSNNNNSKIKKFKKNMKLDKALTIFDSNKRKNLHGSASCFDFRTISKFDDYKNSRNNKKINVTKRGEGAYANNVLFNNYIKNNKNENKSIKFILKSTHLKLNKVTNSSEKKIINKYRKYKNTYINPRKFVFQNFMDKKDFFYNNEYVI